MMRLRSLLKTIAVLLALPLLAYVILLISGGGFGEKQIKNEAFSNRQAPFLFAHRGVTAGAPENSRESIKQAKSKHFKGLEIDIRKSADDQFILFHDDDSKRLLGRDEQVYDLTLEQIGQYPLLFNNATTGSHVLSLKEMLDEFKGDFIIYFDMKLGGLGNIDELVYVIESYDITSSAILASVSVPLIFYIEYNYPSINTALEGFDAGKEWTYFFIPKNLKPDYLSGFASKVDEKHITWLNKHDRISKRIVYGVDSSNYQEMLDLGIRNMIIDYFPGLKVP